MRQELVHGLGIGITSSMPPGWDMTRFMHAQPQVIGGSMHIEPSDRWLSSLPAEGLSRWVAKQCGSVCIIEPRESRVRINRAKRDSSIVIVDVPEHASCDIIDTIDNDDERSAAIAFVRCGKKSTVRYLSLQGAKAGILIREIHLQALPSAKAEIATFDIGARVLLSRAGIEITEHAQGRIVNAFRSSQSQVRSLRSKAHIVGKSAKADVQVIGVGAGKSVSIAKSMIRMESNAEGSVGSQREDLVLLDAGAEVSALPELEIETSRVQCSHAAATGGVDEKQVFYAQSRGLSREEAVRLLMSGFFAQALGHLPEDLAVEARTLLERGA